MPTQDHLVGHSEHRRHRRAHIHRVSVRYELSPNRFIVSDALEMSVEGLFISASRPLPVGRLFEIEIRVLGEPLPIAAVGRVVWTREVDDGEEKPTGMGVRLIDLDDLSRDLIGRLVAGRRETLHGLGPYAFASAAPPVARQAGADGEWPKLYPRLSLPVSESPHPRAGRATEPSIPFDLVTRRVAPSAAARASGRSRDGTRLLAVAALLGLVAFGPRDSAGAATRHRPALVSASPTAPVGLPPVAVAAASQSPAEMSAPAPTARPSPSARPSTDPGAEEARRDARRP